MEISRSSRFQYACKLEISVPFRQLILNWSRTQNYKNVGTKNWMGNFNSYNINGSGGDNDRLSHLVGKASIRLQSVDSRIAFGLQKDTVQAVKK
jgi:hypothetical protein